MKLKLTDNLFLKGLSVLIAMVLWLVIASISDAETTTRFTCDVTLLNTDIITENGKVFRVEEGTDSVKLTVRARQSVIRELKRTDFILTADMEKDLKYDKMVGITVECTNKNIDLDEDVTLNRSNVLVSIEDSASEQFPVSVTHTGTIGEGLVIGSMVPEQTVIKISGPASIVELIDKVEAVVDVTGLPGTAVKTCFLKLYDAADKEIDNTFLNYIGKSDGIDVTVSMLNTKKIPLVFTYSGTPAENYKVKDIDWKPEIIEIAGNPEVLTALTSLRIPAEAVDVEGIEEELQLVVDITPYLPSGVILKDEELAMVLVIVEVEYIEPVEEETEEEGTDESTTTKPSKPTQPSDTEDNQEESGSGTGTGNTDSDKNPSTEQDNSNNGSGDVASKDETSTDIGNKENQETESGSNDKTESNR